MSRNALKKSGQFEEEDVKILKQLDSRNALKKSGQFEKNCCVKEERSNFKTVAMP